MENWSVDPTPKYVSVQNLRKDQSVASGENWPIPRKAVYQHFSNQVDKTYSVNFFSYTFVDVL